MKEFYNKKVIVTGGWGFVGSSLVPKLVEAGALVHVIDNCSRRPETDVFGNYSDVIRGVDYHVHNVSEIRETVYWMQFSDYVFNLAADVAGVIHNQAHNAEMFYGNIAPQVAPVIAASRAGVPNFLQVSSVCAYSPEHNNPALEQYGRAGDPHPANGGYAWSKRMGERAALDWSTGFEKSVVVRPSNVYGSGDWFDDKAHVIPALIRKVHEASDHIVLHGSGRERREFLYVDDAADGMIAAMLHGQSGEAYNLAGHPSGRITIIQLAALIMNLMGKAVDIVTTPDANSGDSIRWSDSSKMKQDADWEAQTDFEDGLRATIDYFNDVILESEKDE